MENPLRGPQRLADLKAFLMRGTVIDLPVGVVIVAAFTAVAGSVGQDPFNLVLGLLPGGIGVSNLFLVLSGERLPPSRPPGRAAHRCRHRCLPQRRDRVRHCRFRGVRAGARAGADHAEGAARAAAGSDADRGAARRDMRRTARRPPLKRGVRA
ncbi:MAG: MscL family protein [Acetobacteraceae bacterium]|nr:MscL family protein [Acetobacteraceae bacterium]